MPSPKARALVLRSHAHAAAADLIPTGLIRRVFLLPFSGSQLLIRPFKFLFFGPVRTDESGGPPLFEPSFKVEGDISHIKPLLLLIPAGRQDDCIDLRQALVTETAPIGSRFGGSGHRTAAPLVELFEFEDRGLEIPTELVARADEAIAPAKVKPRWLMA
jgi:hypothetical protein